VRSNKKEMVKKKCKKDLTPPALLEMDGLRVSQELSVAGSTVRAPRG